MSKAAFVRNNLRNTTGWKNQLDKILAKQGRKRTKAIAIYAIRSDEYWIKLKFRLNENGEGIIYDVNYNKGGDEAVKFFIENPLNFGPFGRVYPLEEPDKFIALAPAYYSPFFQWIEE